MHVCVCVVGRLCCPFDVNMWPKFDLPGIEPDQYSPMTKSETRAGLRLEVESVHRSIDPENRHGMPAASWMYAALVVLVLCSAQAASANEQQQQAEDELDAQHSRAFLRRPPSS
jgi:hypothetical protein